MEKIGRLGYLGLALEDTAGTPEAAPDVFIPFTENSMRGHHEPLMDNASRASRVKDYTSVQGKKWGEGSVSMYLDATNIGYLLKMALGNEARNELNVTPPVYDHLFTPTVSGNAVQAATLWDYKGVDVEQYSYACADVAEIEFTTDGIATINTSLMSRFPSTVSAPTLTTVSGTVFTWKDLNAYFGDTVQGAIDGSVTKLNNFRVQVSNNLKTNYKSGSQQPDSINLGAVEVTGTYTLYFESVTERDKYYGLTKKSIVVTADGAALGTGGYSEQFKMVLKKAVLEEIEYETGLDDLFALRCNFRAEWDQDQAGYVEANLRNGKATDY